jgi:uncharacterized protein
MSALDSFPPLDELRPLAGSDRRLRESTYPAFPFRVTAAGPAHSGRVAHVREQIELVLFTTPGERPHRPEFGTGVESLVFDPGGHALAAMVRQRLVSTLAEALRGEVDPESIRVEVTMEAENRLQIRVRYRLATIGEDQEEVWSLGADRAMPGGGTAGVPG